jgi:hypothetical protein
MAVGNAALDRNSEASPTRHSVKTSKGNPMKSEIAHAYARFARAAEGSEEHAANRWSFDELLIAAMERPEQAWEMIKAVVEFDASPPVMESIAAGPVEELLIQHGEKIIAKVEKDARDSAVIRDLLGGVWKGAMPERVWSKIESLRSQKW